MSILNPETPTPPGIEEFQVRTKKQLVSIARDTLNMLSRQHNDAVRLMWQNQKLTPEEVVAGMGTDAAELFTLMYLLRNFIDTVRPGYIEFTMPMNPTLNEDGTVTLSPIEE